MRPIRPKNISSLHCAGILFVLMAALPSSAFSHRGLVKKFDRPFERQHHEHRGCLGQRKLVEQFDKVSSRQICNLMTDPDEALVQSEVDALPQLFDGWHSFTS